MAAASSFGWSTMTSCPLGSLMTTTLVRRYISWQDAGPVAKMKSRRFTFSILPVSKTGISKVASACRPQRRFTHSRLSGEAAVRRPPPPVFKRW